MYLVLWTLRVQTDHPEDQNKLSRERDWPLSLPVWLYLCDSPSLSLSPVCHPFTIPPGLTCSDSRLVFRPSCQPHFGHFYCFVVVLQQRMTSYRRSVPVHTRPEPPADEPVHPNLNHLSALYNIQNCIKWYENFQTFYKSICSQRVSDGYQSPLYPVQRYIPDTFI